MGEKMILGALRSQGFGISIPRERLRALLRASYPSQMAARWAKMTHRRVYSVPFYNSLWHIDGHHKLIRWKIVIHGGIDGLSRMITFLQAHDNNEAETVGMRFMEACQRHGWPSRVRADYGGENLVVRSMMESVRGQWSFSETH